ncbi:MAG: lysophospholipase [Betaproteobacteria bacterium]|nr:lysophospholipase [Betaproteobacteria bacterium]
MLDTSPLPDNARSSAARPILTLLPGMDGTGELFAPLKDALGDTWDVRCVRYPGAIPLDYPALEALVMSALPKSEPYLLLGESFSGPIAISLAARAPESLRGLVLAATFARSPRPMPSFLLPIISLMPMIPTALLGPWLLGCSNTRTLRAMLNRSLAQVAPKVLRTRLRNVMQVDVMERLRAIRVPILYLRADEDKLIPGSASEAIKAVCPSLHIEAIRAPHGLLQCAPDEAACRIRDFALRIGMIY